MNRFLENQYRYLFVCTFIFFAISVFPQDTRHSSVFGFVSNAINLPLGNVVIILEDNQHQVIAFGQSNVNGKYSINTIRHKIVFLSNSEE